MNQLTKAIVPIFLLLSICTNSFAQTQKPRDAEDYLKILENAKDSLYQQIIVGFEGYITENPEDVAVRIEQCKLIERALYDSYNEYNPNEEEFNQCVESLVAEYPENHEVLLYWLENTWGDSAIALGTQLLDKNRDDPGSWSDDELSVVYQKLANQYRYYGTEEEAIENAEIAQSLNDSIDLTLMLAQLYVNKNQYNKAAESVLSKADSTDEGYSLRNKANLLLEIGMDKEALRLFEYARKDSTIYIDNGKVAEALISNEKFEEAREFLIKDFSNAYDKSTALHNLFVFDYQHAPNDTVLATYRKLVDEDFHNDTFGKYRVMMIFKTPFSGWRWGDVLKLFFIILLIALIIVIPYLWILPIHFISQRFSISHNEPALSASKWGLTDFWLISSGALLIEILAWVIFNYQDMLSTFFSDIFVEEQNKISLNQANQALFYFSMIMVMVLGYLKKTDYQFLRSTQWKTGKSIGLGILFAFLLRAVYFSLMRNGILPGYETSVVSSVVDSLKSINQYYNPYLTFLFAVIIVPFYEEYIFRGIMLNGMDRRIKFIAANIIQSSLFAVLHDNLSLFLFYFLFGLIAGLLVRRSNSLLPALAFHSTNNLFAFIAIMRL